MPNVRPLEELLEKAGAEPGRFYLLQGRGRLLAALPAEPSAFIKTLALYQPQRFLARSWVSLLKFLHTFHAQGLVLRKWSWPGASRASTPCPGVLLGNPAHSVPRAIFIAHEGRSFRVGKFIPDPHQQQVLHHEKSMLELAALHGGHAPLCLGWKPCGPGGILWTEWLPARGRTPSLRERAGILRDWLLPKPPRPLAEFPAWQPTDGWLGSGAADAQASSSILLRPCIRHGDFAPWNLLQRMDGTWAAVDWEEGCPEDAPGLDLVHDLLQQEFLIRRSPPAEAREKMLATLRRTPCADYLAAGGWSGREAWLLDWALAFEARRRPEIQRWIQSR